MQPNYAKLNGCPGYELPNGATAYLAKDGRIVHYIKDGFTWTREDFLKKKREKR